MANEKDAPIYQVFIEDDLAPDAEPKEALVDCGKLSHSHQLRPMLEIASNGPSTQDMIIGIPEFDESPHWVHFCW
jgi:hypothetical protein